MNKQEVKCNTKLRRNCFSMNFSTLAIAFPRQIKKNTAILPDIVDFFKLIGEIHQLVQKRSQKNRRNLALHFTSYLSIALSKILPNLKTTKNTKKLSIFGENDSHCLSSFQFFLNFGQEYLIFKRNNNSFHDNTSAFFDVFLRKKPRTLTPLSRKTCSGIKIENISKKVLDEELLKPDSRKFKKRKVHSSNR